MEITIPSIIQQNPIYISVTLVFALAGLALKITKGIIDFYDEYIVRRFIRRIETLESIVNDDSITKEYLNNLKKDEVFRLASGFKVNNQKSELLMNLYNKGLIDHQNMKLIQRYIEPDSNKVIIELNFIDKLLFAYSFVMALFIFLYGMSIYVIVINQEGSANFVIGSIVMLTCAFIARILSRDFRNYRYLNKLAERLRHNGLMSSANKAIPADPKKRRSFGALLFRVG